MGMKHFNEVLKKYKAAELPISENSVGDLMINPSYRKKMKKEMVEAWVEDLIEELDPQLADVILNQDGIMIICQNDGEGYYTVENMLKIKNLDYDAEDC